MGSCQRTGFCVVALTAASFSSACAQTLDLEFIGSILDSCTVSLGTGGTLAADATSQSLSSANPGGASGSALVIATGTTYELEVDAPSAFTVSPPGGDTNTVFSASYSATGATISGTLLPGVNLSIGLGLTTVSVDAAATKTVGVFPAGNYAMTTAVRCVAP